MIEEELFKEYKAFMLANSIFSSTLDIFSSTPQSIIKFPTIIMKEINNTDYTQGNSIDKLEYVSTLNYRVSIYSKQVVKDGVKYQPKQVINELRKLTQDFFRNVGLNRDVDRPVDNIDLSISRQEMTFSGHLRSWNNYL